MQKLVLASLGGEVFPFRPARSTTSSSFLFFGALYAVRVHVFLEFTYWLFP